MNDKVSILIVDDLKENHFVMESILDDDDINIVKALSGEEALSLCMAHSFAVIFMDVQMPGMDGFETAELLRGIEKTKHIPIIFVTALNNEEASIFKGYEVGAVDYLSKPIDPIILKSKARIFKEMFLQRRMIEKQAIELECKLKELTKMQEEKEYLESISIQDDLTKLYNRRGIDKYMKIHWENCIKYRLPFSIIMFDLDRFKEYNDNYGHLQGDEVLKKVALRSKKLVFRSEDFVGRYGGEEFLVVMPNTNLEGALLCANRIHEGIIHLAIEHKYNEDQGIVTVSCGISSIFPDKNASLKSVIEKADEAMYLAKKNGRNQIRHHAF